MGSCISKAEELEKFSIKGLLSLIMSTIMSDVIPMVPISVFIIAIGVKLRPGMSASKISESTLMDCSDAGIPMGDLFGEKNLYAEAIILSQKNLITGIKETAVGDGVIQPGGMKTIVNTVGVLGPTAGSGVNILPTSLQTIIT